MTPSTPVESPRDLVLYNPEDGAGAHALERGFTTPKPLSTRLLTPSSTNDGLWSSEMVDTASADLVARTVLAHPRLPDLLNYILQAQNEGVALNDGFILAISNLSTQQRWQVASFAHNLSQACDALGDDNLYPMNEQIDGGYEQMPTEDGDNDIDDVLVEKRPIELASIEPQSTQSEIFQCASIEFGLVEPGLFEDGSIDPGFINPEPAEPEPVEPGSSDSEPLESGFLDSESVNSESINSESESVGSEYVDSEPLEPQPAEPEPAEPEPVEPEPVVPEPVEPELAEPGVLNPTPVDPAPVELDTVDPDTCRTEISEALAQSHFQHDGVSNPHCRRFESTEAESSQHSSSFRPATSFPTTVPCDRPDPDLATSSAAASDTIIVGSLPDSEPTTIEGAASPSAPPEVVSIDQRDDDEQINFELIEKSIEDFVYTACEQVLLFSTPSSKSEATYKGPYHPFNVENGKNRAQWSDGSGWISLLLAAEGERHKSSLRFALHTQGFSKWHASQVESLEEGSARKAAQEVTGKLLGPKPNKDEAKQNEWERRRKKFNTWLSCERKWSLLTRELGDGILLIDAWYLAKCKDSELRIVIDGLRRNPEKMTVLRLLADQIKLLIDKTQTSPAQFRNELATKNLAFSGPGSPTDNADLGSLYHQIQDSCTGSTQLVVKDTDFVMNMSSLQKLVTKKWMNDEIIFACLHLSDKFSFVRVGFSIPLQKQTRARGIMQRPFEKASKQIAEWQSQVQSETRLICIFLLLLPDNHFSLLEINEGDSALYHYTLMDKAENSGIKVRIPYIIQKC
ncbi:hypothetical protein QQX98_012829 [Neonectria punicea]|uniref:Ubiquitin-like protease family profile domain-containing protein n=1 Tax=Neonectria punicea TaxID=979145 RepID=A0ABR1GI66_9HYPO